jgi:hypothetical protein
VALAVVIASWPGIAGAFTFEVLARTTDQFGAGQEGASSSSSLPVGMSSDQNWEQTGATAQSEALTAAGIVVSQQLIPLLGARSYAHWQNRGVVCPLCDPNVAPSSGGHTEASAMARFLLGSFIIDGPPGTPQGTVVPLSVNFFIEGGISADRLGDNMGASASVDVFGRINSNRDSGVFSLGGVFTCERGPGALGFSCPNTDGTNYFQGTGALAGVSNATGHFSAVAASPPWTAMVGVPFEIGLELVTGAAVFEYQDGAPINFATAVSDFFNTAGLWDGGPLFILPDGYTAHSEDGLVVDNRLVRPAPVPEAPTLALFLLDTAAALAAHSRARYIA